MKDGGKLDHSSISYSMKKKNKHKPNYKINVDDRMNGVGKLHHPSKNNSMKRKKRTKSIGKNKDENRTKGTGKLHHSASYSMKKKRKFKPIGKMKVTTHSGEMKANRNPQAVDIRKDALFRTHYELFDEEAPSESKSSNDSLLDKSDACFTSEPVPSENELTKKSNLTEEQRLKIKEIYSHRKKLAGEVASLLLCDAGCEASLCVEESVRYPLFFPDIQDFLSYLQDNLQSTRWIRLRKKHKVCNIILLCVEGIGLDSYLQHHHSCPSLSSYKVAVEFVSPLSYGDVIEHCLASKLDPKPLITSSSNVQDGFVVGLDSLFNINPTRQETLQDIQKVPEPPTEIKEEKTVDNGSSECLAQVSEEETEVDMDSVIEAEALDSVSKEFDIPVCTLKRLLENPELYVEKESKHVLPLSLQSEDKFSRVDLILTPREMANEKYPLPFGPRYCMFAKTKREYSQVKEDSPMMGLDCEMCMTRMGNEITRISVVNERHEVVYERLIKPYNRIINYLTRYSGITPIMMRDVTTRLPDVQSELRNILPSDAILIGQSLNCDLVAMKMMHPYVIDTSLIYNMTGKKAMKTKLKTLCAEFLSWGIQDAERNGHDSIEDSLAALKLVQEKLKHSLQWGNACLGYQRTEEESRQARDTLLNKEKSATNSKAKPDCTKSRLAFNSIVDDPHLFLPPSHSKQSLRDILHSYDKLKKEIKKDKMKLRKRKLSKQCDNSSLDNSTGCKSRKSKRRKVEEKSGVVEVNSEKLLVSDDLGSVVNGDVLRAPCEQIKSRTVVIIGKDEVVGRYRKCLPLHLHNKVHLLPSKSNSNVVDQVKLQDSQNENSIIIAHVRVDQLSKVNEWSKSLLSVCNPNDLMCISLNGSQNSSDNRGAFLSSVPFLDRLPSIKTLSNEYLLSQDVL